jgi:mono/diheme cytochrome c family protein
MIFQGGKLRVGLRAFASASEGDSERGRGRRAVWAAFACALLVASSAACSSTSGGASTDSETARLYRRQCAACHGPEGAGGQVGQLKVADLRAPHALAFSDEEMFKKIYEGGNGMPPFKYSLSDQQMYDLVRFIRRDIQQAGKK